MSVLPTNINIVYPGSAYQFNLLITRFQTWYDNVFSGPDRVFYYEMDNVRNELANKNNYSNPDAPDTQETIKEARKIDTGEGLHSLLKQNRVITFVMFKYEELKDDLRKKAEKIIKKYNTSPNNKNLAPARGGAILKKILSPIRKALRAKGDEPRLSALDQYGQTCVRLWKNNMISA